MHHQHRRETQPLQQSGPQQQRQAGGVEQFESDYEIQQAGRQGQMMPQQGQGMTHEGQGMSQQGMTQEGQGVPQQGMTQEGQGVPQQGMPPQGQEMTQRSQGTAHEGHLMAQESRGMDQQMGPRLQDVETPQQRVAVDDITRAIQVCEWCADQCIQLADPSMIECIRHCRDVSELGQQALVLIPRNSPYTEMALRTFKQAVQACGQECSRHPHGHCQECAQVLDETARAIDEMIGMAGQRGGQTAQPVGPQQGGTQQISPQ